MSTESALTLGEAIRRARERQGLSQEVLAALVGVGQPRLSDYERGDQLPSPWVVMQLSVALDLDNRAMQQMLVTGRAQRLDRDRDLPRERNGQWMMRPCSPRIRVERDGITDTALQALMRAAGEQEQAAEGRAA